MDVYFLLYDGFSGFEMMFPAFVFRNTHPKTVGEKKMIISEENLHFMPDILISELDADKVDVLIIPGGSALQHLKDGSEIQDLLEKLHQKNKIIAAICGSPVLFANTSILENKKFTAGYGELPDHWQKNFTKGEYKNQDIVVDGNIITAKGVAVASFAVVIGKKVGLFKDEEEEERIFNIIQEIR
ncbi:MAG: DJ-1/PfpI family protein [Candidatus Thorarchaeota archaeon]